MLSVFFPLILSIVCLLISAFCAFVETVFTSLRLYKISELKRTMVGYESFFKIWDQAPDRILISILLVNNASDIIGSIALSKFMENCLGSLGLLIGIALSTFITMLGGSILPKSFARQLGTTNFAFVLKVLSIFLNLFGWLVDCVFYLSQKSILLFFKDIKEDTNDEVSEKEVEFLIRYGKQKGILSSKKSELLKNILDLELKSAFQIMVDRKDVFMLFSDMTASEALQAMSKVGFSRAPVIDASQVKIESEFAGESEKKSKFVGMVHYKDLFAASNKDSSLTVGQFVRSVLNFSLNDKLIDCLKAFIQHKLVMALVEDDNKNFLGLITLEDVLEEVVGEIKGEFEPIKNKYSIAADGGYILDGSLDLSSVSELLNISFDTLDLNLHDFIVSKLQRDPAVGDFVVFGKYKFEVVFVNKLKAVKVAVFAVF